ncbi:MAG: hypothetical protein BWY06_00725 [Candidatus Latescibacteria bacterium ADurb.Bin168]|nr:MAG: hypothetical protein BWY06_00725 [Candidatus Latescibacteria bacterium ADurb.Bin168]
MRLVISFSTGRNDNLNYVNMFDAATLMLRRAPRRVSLLQWIIKQGRNRTNRHTGWPP